MASRTHGLFAGFGAFAAAAIFVAPAMGTKTRLYAAGDAVSFGELSAVAIASFGDRGTYAVDVAITNRSLVTTFRVSGQAFAARTAMNEGMANLSRSSTVLEPGETKGLRLLFSGRASDMVLLRVPTPPATLANWLGKERVQVLPVAQADLSDVICPAESNCVP